VSGGAVAALLTFVVLGGCGRSSSGGALMGRYEAKEGQQNGMVQAAGRDHEHMYLDFESGGKVTLTYVANDQGTGGHDPKPRDASYSLDGSVLRLTVNGTSLNGVVQQDGSLVLDMGGNKILFNSAW